MSRLEHGGNLAAAIAQFGGRRAQWIDLSTGISPLSWPVPALPESVWRRLPEEEDGLRAAAAACYGCDPAAVLPLPGSQHAIRLLPTLTAPAVVALPAWGYGEHALAWSSAGHRCHFYRDIVGLQRLLVEVQDLRFAVVIHPGNPCASQYEPADLLKVAKSLEARGGYLLVDEAFIDPDPARSLAAAAGPGLVVLRSIGKFFGLAGLRLGFVIAGRALLAEVAAATNPWSVSHPARWVGGRALGDTAWQRGQRGRVRELSRQWIAMLAEVMPAQPLCSAGLFASVELPFPVAYQLQQDAARRYLWSRVYGPQQGLAIWRLGLPAPNQMEEAARRLDGIAS